MFFARLYIRCCLKATRCLVTDFFVVMLYFAEVQVFKPMIGVAKDPIITRRIGRKQTQIVYTQGVSHQRTKQIETKEADQAKLSFSDADAMTLAKWCVDIEKHYSQHHGQATPMDIEVSHFRLKRHIFVIVFRI